jgi:hypothetical protein
VSSAAIILCVASQECLLLLFILLDRVRKLLDTPSYMLRGTQQGDSKRIMSDMEGGDHNLFIAAFVLRD